MLTHTITYLVGRHTMTVRRGMSSTVCTLLWKASETMASQRFGISLGESEAEQRGWLGDGRINAYTYTILIALSEGTKLLCCTFLTNGLVTLLYGYTHTCLRDSRYVPSIHSFLLFTLILCLRRSFCYHTFIPLFLFGLMQQHPSGSFRTLQHPTQFLRNFHDHTWVDLVFIYTLALSHIPFPRSCYLAIYAFFFPFSPTSLVNPGYT